MIQVNSTKVLNIYLTISDLKKINLQKIGLIKSPKQNQFIYHSNAFEVLNYKFKNEINFLIFYKEKNIYLELLSLKGIPEILKQIITIKIKVDIYQNGGFCKAKREISLSLRKKISFLKFLSDELIYKLLLKALDKISKRFDKKFLRKIINV